MLVVAVDAEPTSSHKQEPREERAVAARRVVIPALLDPEPALEPTEPMALAVAVAAVALMAARASMLVVEALA